jgi:hypothetical protein
LDGRAVQSFPPVSGSSGVETAGPFDLDAELKLWISGSETPIIKQFNRSLDIYERQRVLAAYVLR